MTVSGYGYSAWGTSPYGAEVGLVSIIRAFAAGDRVVIVDLDFAPQALGAQYPGDALNPASWLVVSSPQGEDRVVAQVEKLTGTRFRLVTLFALGSHTQTNIVSTHGIRNVAGVVQPDTEDAFQGCGPAPLIAPQIGQTGDLRNVQSESLENVASGTLVVTSEGDYALGTIEETVRKLILRRLTIPRGGFTWLPDYGTNLPVKGLVSVQALGAIRDDVRRQVLKEPEVVEAGVRASIPTPGTVVVQVQARLRTGTSVNVAARVVVPA